MTVDHDNKDLYIHWEYYSKDKTDEEIAKIIKPNSINRRINKSELAEPKAIRYYKQKGLILEACRNLRSSRNVYTKSKKI